MSTIAVFGATGFAGGHIVDEAIARGHKVIAVTRSAPADDREGVTVRAGRIDDLELVGELSDRADIIVIAIHGWADGKSFLPPLVPGLLEAIGTSARLGVVGGAGSLRVAEDGPVVMETPKFSEAAKPEAGAMADVLAALGAADAETDWFYVSPSGLFGRVPAAPTERRGTYRVGGDVLLRDEEGKASISGADYALAFVDEIDGPVHSRERFTVGY